MPGVKVGERVGGEVGDSVGEAVGATDSVTVVDSNPTNVACTLARAGLLATKVCTKEPSAMLAFSLLLSASL